MGLLRHKVENALYDYAAAADDLDADALAALLSDATLTFGQEIATGRGQIKALFERKFHAAPLVRHLLSNVRIDDVAVTGGAARVRAHCHYVRVAYADRPAVLSLGDYMADLDVETTVGFDRPAGVAPVGVRFRALVVTPLWAAS